MTDADAIAIVVILALAFPSAAALAWWLGVAFRRITSAECPWLQRVEVAAPHDDLILHVRIPPAVRV
jgi:hypothetical protein